MINLNQISIGDWIALYAAILSTIMAVVCVVRYAAQKVRMQKERHKFQTDLYFLCKIDRVTKQTHPVVVVLLANLGSERISLKSLEYEGVSENGSKISGTMGWYEQPEELYGIRNRLLPIVLESGQTADLPMIEIGVLRKVHNLKIWLTDFNGQRHYLADNDINDVRCEVEKFIQPPPKPR